MTTENEFSKKEMELLSKIKKLEFRLKNVESICNLRQSLIDVLTKENDEFNRFFNETENWQHFEEWLFKQEVE